MVCDIHRGLTERGGRAANGDDPAFAEREDAHQACPCGGIGLRNGRQVLPRKVAVDSDDIGRWHANLFGVAAVHAAPQAADQGHHLLARRKATIGVGPDRSHAFDGGDFGHIAPCAFAEIDFSMVEPEGFDIDDHVAGFRLRIGTFLDLQDFRTAVLLDDNCTHLSRSVWTLTDGIDTRVLD